MWIKIRLCFQHVFNPLHVYCRLRDAGLSRRLSVLLCRVYERRLTGRGRRLASSWGER